MLAGRSCWLETDDEALSRCAVTTPENDELATIEAMRTAINLRLATKSPLWDSHPKQPATYFRHAYGCEMPANTQTAIVDLSQCIGTAKGGILFAIANELNLPIRFIGIGETIDDLRKFEAKPFVDALFNHQA